MTRNQGDWLGLHCGTLSFCVVWLGLKPTQQHHNHRLTTGPIFGDHLTPTPDRHRGAPGWEGCQGGGCVAHPSDLTRLIVTENAELIETLYEYIHGANPI